MSVIASNSVNFVPIYQILQNSTDLKAKELPKGSIEEKSNQILDFVELSPFAKNGQSKPISLGNFSSEKNIEKPETLILQETVMMSKQNQIDSKFVLKNTDFVSSFIRDSKGKAMSQQANQSKERAISLI